MNKKDAKKKFFEKEKWNIWKILSLVLAMAALVCAVILMFVEENNVLLIAGSVCVCAAMIIFAVILAKSMKRK